RWRHEGLLTVRTVHLEERNMTSVDAPLAPPAQERRRSSGFWTVTYAFLVVMAFATLPSPLYGLYRVRDHLSAITITVVFAIWAAGTIAALIAVPFVAQ